MIKDQLLAEVWLEYVDEFDRFNESKLVKVVFGVKMKGSAVLQKGSRAASWFVVLEITEYTIDIDREQALV